MKWGSLAWGEAIERKESPHGLVVGSGELLSEGRRIVPRCQMHV